MITMSGITQFEPQSFAQFSRSAAMLFNRIAQDQTFAARFTAAANAGDVVTLQTMCASAGMPGRVERSTQQTIVTIEITVCYDKVCYKVTIIIH